MLEWVAFPFSRDLPNPGIEPRSLPLQTDSLRAELPGKPKNTGVGNLSLFQGIFPTQESNRGLLHCRRILYQLSYQVSPRPRLLLNIPHQRLSSPGTGLWSVRNRAAQQEVSSCKQIHEASSVFTSAPPGSPISPRWDRLGAGKQAGGSH